VQKISMSVTDMGSQRLDCTGRPEVVAAWFKNGRKLKNIPAIENIDGYVGAWITWWTSLQPSWRGLNLARKKPMEHESWEQICKGGNNGFFIIMITLAWWKVHGGASDQFQEMLEDVMWVCEQMMESMEAVGEETGPSKKK
jgi:hypothetical protein